MCLHNHKSVFTRKSFASSQPFVFEAANNSRAGEQERQEEGANVEHWSLFHASLQLSLCSQTIVTLDLWSICKLSSWLDGKGANMKDTQLTRTWQEETCRPSWVCTTTSSESSSGRPSWLGNRRMLALLCISSQIPLLLFISFFLFIFFHHRLFSGLGSGSEPCWPGNDFRPPANIKQFSASIFFFNHGKVQVSLCITVNKLFVSSFWTKWKFLNEGQVFVLEKFFQPRPGPICASHKSGLVVGGAGRIYLCNWMYICGARPSTDPYIIQNPIPGASVWASAVTLEQQSASHIGNIFIGPDDQLCSYYSCSSRLPSSWTTDIANVFCFCREGHFDCWEDFLAMIPTIMVEGLEFV